jgi:acetyl-CoA synthetase
MWEPNEKGARPRKITYGELFELVCRCAAQLRALGVEKGDRVVLYMPLIPEALVSMLACARIGAVHSVVFAGFSSVALADRIIDSGAKLVITADGGYRGTKLIPTSAIVAESLRFVKERLGLNGSGAGSVTHVLLVPHLEAGGGIGGVQSNEEKELLTVDWVTNVVRWDSESPVKPAPAEIMDSEDTLFILYTSGSTGKPKGVVHTVGGYMVYTGYTFENVFQYDAGDVFWCTADVGWITGHSYVVYGPLLCGATIVLYEGTPFSPDAGRFWDIVDSCNVTHFYTAPTAIRALQASGTSFVEPYSLRSLKVIGSVGEPINEDAWHWYHNHIGKSRCPVVDTWWQTETGGIMISSLAGIIPTKPCFSALPMPGVEPVIMDNDGNELTGRGVEGNLAIRHPWPSMIRTTFGDSNRYRENYFQRFPEMYFTGDGARRDEDGYYRILGRVDDVINVSGHRLGTAEIENAINEHPLVVESAVIGVPHEIKGQCVVAFVVGEPGVSLSEIANSEISALVTELIGAVARPERVVVVSSLPKTRSGKIMRRILRVICEGRANDIGDTSTLLNPEIVPVIIELWGT